MCTYTLQNMYRHRHIRTCARNLHTCIDTYAHEHIKIDTGIDTCARTFVKRACWHNEEYKVYQYKSSYEMRALQTKSVHRRRNVQILQAWAFIQNRSLCLCLLVCVYMCACICTCACVHVHMCKCEYTYRYTYICPYSRSKCSCIDRLAHTQVLPNIYVWIIMCTCTRTDIFRSVDTCAHTHLQKSIISIDMCRDIEKASLEA